MSRASLTAPPPARPPRVGLVGLGRWGQVLLRNLSGRADLTLAAVATSRPPPVLPAGCGAVAAWQDLLNLDLDGVVVATPPASHAEICAAALRRNLGLLVEKPLTLDLAEARALAAMAETCDGLVMVDHIHLFSPAFRRLKQLARQLGPVRAVAARAGNHGPYRSDAGVLWDWGAHDVAMLLDLLGDDPDLLRATRLERRAVAGGMGETIRLDLGFGPVTARVEIGTLMDKTRRFQVECAAGTLVYDDLDSAKLRLDGQPMDISGQSPLDIAISEFARRLTDGDRDRDGLRLGVRVVDILARAQAELPP